jgi:hypothetical protein
MGPAPAEDVQCRYVLVSGSNPGRAFSRTSRRKAVLCFVPIYITHPLPSPLINFPATIRGRAHPYLILLRPSDRYD